MSTRRSTILIWGCIVSIGVWILCMWKIQMELSFAQESLLTRNDVPAFVLDHLCRGCRHTVVDEQQRCGWYTQAKENLPQVCRKACYTDDVCDKRLFRYDSVLTVSSVILPSSSVEPSYWLANSVPQHHRLPVTAVSNVTHFLSDDNSVFPNAEYFFDYNPSIVPFMVNTGTANLGLSLDRHYLVSFRVSNQHSCLHPEDRKRMAGIAGDNQQQQTSKDYLGLAVLNTAFQVVTEATVDLKAVGFPGAQDFRLFQLGENTYVTSNDLIAELILTTKDTTNIPGAISVPDAFNKETSLRVWVRHNPSCAPCGKRRGFCGKNFNYFATNEEILAEIWPSGPHTVRPVVLGQPCQRSVPARSYVDNPKNLLPSFATTEEIDFPLLAPHQTIFTNRGRGSACCVPIIFQGQELQLGIQHRKTPSQRNAQLPPGLIDNHYVSSFYAFKNKPPFQQVAESGQFCLEFGNAELTKANDFRQLKIGRTFNCPRIHFVSGMIQDSPDSLIISYGVNDCVSRFVRVRVEDVLTLLFRGPS